MILWSSANPAEMALHARAKRRVRHRHCDRSELARIDWMPLIKSGGGYGSGRRRCRDCNGRDGRGRLGKQAVREGQVHSGRRNRDSGSGVGQVVMPWFWLRQHDDDRVRGDGSAGAVG
jgi:hypothetical protein